MWNRSFTRLFRAAGGGERGRIFGVRDELRAHDGGHDDGQRVGDNAEVGDVWASHRTEVIRKLSPRRVAHVLHPLYEAPPLRP